MTKYLRIKELPGFGVLNLEDAQPVFDYFKIKPMSLFLFIHAGVIYQTVDNNDTFMESKFKIQKHYLLNDAEHGIEIDDKIEEELKDSYKKHLQAETELTRLKANSVDKELFLKAIAAASGNIFKKDQY